MQTACLFVVLKATEGRKAHKRDNCVSTYPALSGIQLPSDMAGYSAVTAVKPKRRSGYTCICILWKSSKVLHDEATYMNNKTVYEPGRTAYARMKKY